MSSVLNDDQKQFGRANLFDGSRETCWNSAQGQNQWINCQFAETVDITKVLIMFQGGFTGKVFYKLFRLGLLIIRNIKLMG